MAEYQQSEIKIRMRMNYEQVKRAFPTIVNPRKHNADSVTTKHHRIYPKSTQTPVLGIPALTTHSKYTPGGMTLPSLGAVTV